MLAIAVDMVEVTEDHKRVTSHAVVPYGVVVPFKGPRPRAVKRGLLERLKYLVPAFLFLS